MLANKWLLHKPAITPDGRSPQADFVLLDELEALYGGACAGGKSEALLMCGLQFVDWSDYHGIIFRKSLTDLTLPGALIDRSHEWLDCTAAKWNGISHTWTFPSGAQLAFGYMENERDVYRYYSAEFHYIGFDQVEQFSEFQYRTMLSRARKLKGSVVAVRVRCTANPGGEPWVKQRFLVEGPSNNRPFIPAFLKDNPFLDAETYIKAMDQLDPVTRQMLLFGNWDVRPKGNKFQRGWFEVVEAYPADLRKIRFWDKAATQPKRGKDPDWTVGALAGFKAGVYYVLDVVRFRGTPQLNEKTIKQTAKLDGYDVEVFMEQEPGSSGVNDIDHYARNILPGFSFRGVRSTGDKELYANPVSSAAEAGNVKIVCAPWNTDFLDEFEAFPEGPHDDIVDSVSKTCRKLVEVGEVGGDSVDKFL